MAAARPRAPAEDHAGNEPKQPPEDRGEDDDPHERHLRRTDHPAELHPMRVGEGDQVDEQRVPDLVAPLVVAHPARRNSGEAEQI